MAAWAGPKPVGCGPPPVPSCRITSARRLSFRLTYGWPVIGSYRKTCWTNKGNSFHGSASRPITLSPKPHPARIR